MQSDTSIESEDSFASVIFVPKSDQQTNDNYNLQQSSNKKPSVPSSPLILPCPCPTPIHSPAARAKLHSNTNEATKFTFEDTQLQKQADCTIKQQDISKNNLTTSANTSLNSSKLSTTVTMTKPNSTAKIKTILTPPSVTSLLNTTTNLSSGNAAVEKKTQTKTEGLLSTSNSIAKVLPKITRQTIKDLPPIPKFKHLSSFPIVRRISTTKVVVPKLMSLEIFNPETDDLDSDCDSSEPSSPDSIDSVINALQPTSSNSSLHPSQNPSISQDTSCTDKDSSTAQNDNDNDIAINSKSISPIPLIIEEEGSCKTKEINVPPIIEAAAVLANELENTVDYVMRSTTDNDIDIDIENNGRLYINKNDINLNVNINQNINTATDNINCHNDMSCSDNDNFSRRQHLVDFAEKLSAQLLKELEENSEDNINRSPDYSADNKYNSDDFSDSNNDNAQQKLDKLLLNNLDDPYLKKINGEIKNLNQLREELRERRLMLANLSTMQQTNSCSQQATMKKSAQKIINFIPELDENDDEECILNLNDSASNATNMMCHDRYAINSNSVNINNTHDTALLIQEEDSSDELLHNESDVITDVNKRQILKNSKNKLCSTTSDSHRNNKYVTNNPISTNYNKKQSTGSKPNPSSFESNNSCESWANSNSTASLDSPSIGGGSATHHRYYHVFREGELDALINHHVTSLHIVSSYYERASWCVVCEKVQVWTI